MSWIPIGPISTRSIAIYNHLPLSGRVRGIAVSATGSRVYVAPATGGVFRSDDGGATWVSTTDNWVADATTSYASPLACGAIVIDPTNVDRVFVGTGEDEYQGVGPIRSDSGGLGVTPWVIEPVAPGSTPLDGKRFSALAIDPNNIDRVVATTSAGVYRREPDGVGGFHWVQQAASTKYTDVVVVSSGGVTTFYLARRSSPAEPAAVLVSSDGASWTPLGTGFPASDVGPIRLAVQPGNPNLVYALKTNPGLIAVELYRLDLPDPQWRLVSGLPLGVFIGQPPLVIAVDPNDAGRIFFGSVLLAWATVTPSGSGPNLTYSMTATKVTGIHVDHYALRYVGSDSNKLWMGGDGGVYFTDSAAGAVTISSKNIGLPALQAQKIGLHPTEDGVLFIGTQDNDVIRYDGDEVWRNLGNMDGGAVLVNWNDPYKVFANTFYGGFKYAIDGAQDFSSWTFVNMSVNPPAIYPPVAGTPPDPANPASADLVAVGGTRLWLSNTFGGGWYSVPNNAPSDDLPGADDISALVFASASRIYAGSSQGHVYRYDFNGVTWSRSVLPQIPSVFNISLVAVDPADPSLHSLYIAAFSAGDYRRVWHWDGTSMNWEPRSGPSPGTLTSLPNRTFQALAVDPAFPQTLFAGAATGVWRSLNGGLDWARFDDNLPRAPVLDLKIHPLRRTLYAVTYGRGVYALDLDVRSPLAVELYISDTALDLGKRPTVDGLPDPLQPGQKVFHWDGPDIKVDAPGPGNVYQFTPPINDFQFVDGLDDLSGAVETIDLALPPVVNRVYIQVHNRGLVAASGHVMLLLANASTTLPDLPAGYTSKVQMQTAISSADWSTVGVQPISDLRVGYPRILEFDLPSTMLPPPAGLPGNSHWCALALVHGTQDPFTSTEIHVDTLTVKDRKATNKNLYVVPVSMMKMMMAAVGRGKPRPWVPLRLNAPSGVEELGDLVFDLRSFRGQVYVVLPEQLERYAAPSVTSAGARKKVDRRHERDVERRIRDVVALEKAGRFDARWCKQMVSALEAVRRGRVRTLPGGKEVVLLSQPPIQPGSSATLFLAFDPDLSVKVGDRFRVTAYHRGNGKIAAGGSTWEVRIVQ